MQVFIGCVYGCATGILKLKMKWRDQGKVIHQKVHARANEMEELIKKIASVYLSLDMASL